MSNTYDNDPAYYHVVGYNKYDRPVIAGEWRYATDYYTIMAELKRLEPTVIYADVQVLPNE